MERVGEWVIFLCLMTMMMGEMQNLGVYIMITCV